MVMDAAGEPEPLDVGHELGPAGVGPVALVALDDGVEGPQDRDVVLVVLVEEDVPAAEGRLAEVVDQLFLLRRQGLEAGDLVAQDLQVGELVDLPLELRRGRGGGLGRGFLLFAAGGHEDQAEAENGEEKRALDVHRTGPPRRNSDEEAILAHRRVLPSKEGTRSSQPTSSPVDDSREDLVPLSLLLGRNRARPASKADDVVIQLEVS